jgi:hypothetical protein
MMIRLRLSITTLWVILLICCSGNVLAVSFVPEITESDAFAINSGFNDVWYDPLTDGQGFTISVFEDKGTVFLAWLTYDTDLPGTANTANLGDSGQRWLMAIGPYEGAQAELVVYSASGGLFDAALPLPELNSVGSIFLQFQDCNAGMITYELPGIGRNGSIPIERIASDNVARCEAMMTPVLPSESCYVSEGEEPSEFSRLFAVWGSSSTDVFAVGGSGTILHYDGGDWTAMTWGADFGLEGVWGSGSNNVFAVGGYDGFGLALGVIMQYDGDCWRVVFSTTEYQFTHVWGSSDSDVFAATSRGPVLHFDGTGWTPMKSGTAAMDGLGGVWGSLADDVFAVGGDEIWHYDGATWQFTASMGASITEGTLSLRRVWGSSSTDVFAVGTRYMANQAIASIWHYDGTGWEFMPSGTEGARWDVWGSSSGDVFVVGDTTGSYGSDKGLISHYNGSTWTNSIAANTPTLQGVWGSGANDIYAVGGGARNGFCCMGAGTILHFDGSTWKTVMEYGQFR